MRGEEGIVSSMDLVTSDDIPGPFWHENFIILIISLVSCPLSPFVSK